MPEGASLDAIYADYRNDTSKQAASRAALATVAQAWGLQFVSYEGGPGWNVGTMTNLGSYIIAQRHTPMKAIVENDVTAWAAAGGNSYNHFTAAGLYSRSGQWGHVEHYFNTTSKSAALLWRLQPPRAYASPRTDAAATLSALSPHRPTLVQPRSTARCYQ